VPAAKGKHRLQLPYGRLTIKKHPEVRLELKERLARALPPMLRHIPRDKKWLYPFFLAGNIVLREEERRLDALPGAFDGYAVAYASDIHFGAYLDARAAVSLCERLTALRADLILLGGDYGEDQEQAIAFFNAIPSFPAGAPVLAALGNHDYPEGGKTMEPLLRAMREKNVQPLVNQTRVFRQGDDSLAVCVPDDFRCGKPDFQALKEQSDGARFVLLSTHSPDLLPDAAEAGLRFDLALCGHTHGGQVALFGRSLLSSSIYGNRFRAGWYRAFGAEIFVSCGAGTSILPLRLGTRSEIHRLVLRVNKG